MKIRSVLICTVFVLQYVKNYLLVKEQMLAVTGKLRFFRSTGEKIQELPCGKNLDPLIFICVARGIETKATVLLLIPGTVSIPHCASRLVYLLVCLFVYLPDYLLIDCSSRVV